MSPTELKCRIVSFLAGNGTALDGHLAAVTKMEMDGAESKITKNKRMPKDRQKHVRDEAEKVIAAVVAAPKLLRDHAAGLFGPGTEWMGDPEHLQTAQADVAREQGDGGGVRGKEFETVVATWARRRFTEAVVVPNALMTGKSAGAGVKREVDALVLKRSGLQDSARSDMTTAPSAEDARLRDTLVDALDLRREVEELASRVLRLRLRVDRTHRTRFPTHDHPPVEEESRQAVHRWLALHAPRQAAEACAAGLGAAVHTTLISIVEAKVGTNSLPDDLKRCMALKSELMQAAHPGYKTWKNRKNKGADAVVEFWVPRNGFHIDVCVAQASGTTLVDLLSRSVLLHAKMKQLKCIATAAFASPSVQPTLLRDVDTDQLIAVQSMLEPGLVDELVCSGLRRIAFARALIQAKALSYWVFSVGDP
jgi:hypothetical protein